MRMGLQRIVGWASVPVGVAVGLWMALLTTHPYACPGPGLGTRRPLPRPAGVFAGGVHSLRSNRGGHGDPHLAGAAPPDLGLTLRIRRRIISVRGRRLYPRRVLVIRTRLPFPETLGDVSGVSCARYVAVVPASR